MTTMHYLYPEGISLYKNKKLTGKSTYAFAICGGEIKLSEESVKRVEGLNWGNNAMDFISNDSNSSLNLKFEDIQYNSAISDAYYNSPEKIVKVVKGAILQSLIYNAYNVKTNYDFFNEPELIVKNGYIRDLKMDILNDLQKIIIDRTIDVITKNNRINEAKLLNSDNKGKLSSDDVIWFSYEYDISSYTNSNNSSIVFLIGWTIKNVNDFCYVEGNVYKEGIYDIKIFKFEDYTKCFGECKTLNDGTFTFKMIKKDKECSKYITSLSSIGNFQSCMINNSEEVAELSPINTIIVECFNNNRNISYEDTNNRIMSNISQIDRINSYLEVLILYISSYVGNTKEIASVLGKFIYGYGERIDVLDKTFSERYLRNIEDLYGVISNSEAIIENLWLSLKKVESGENVLKSMELIQKVHQVPITRTSMYTFKYTVDLDQKSRGTTIKSPIDFMIYSQGNGLEFYPNDFSVDWQGSKSLSKGAKTIKFKIDSTKKIRIVPNSKRAKMYLWLKDKQHTMETLLKGLFGELLLSTSIVPAERTVDDSGINGNEPYKGYITTKSLMRSITQSPNSYFVNETTNIVSDLTKYYRMLWDEDEEAYSNLLNNEGKKGIFRKGDVLEIPIDILMRYNMCSTLGKNCKSRKIDGSFSFMLNFEVC